MNNDPMNLVVIKVKTLIFLQQGWFTPGVVGRRPCKSCTVIKGAELSFNVIHPQKNSNSIGDFPRFKMEKCRKNLKKYLEIEKHLNGFFKA